jgi:hypothetical protein
MSCSRIRRELLWLSRFGELDTSSGPHLDHLVGCRACRDAIGVDRLMVEQLRIALAARVAQVSPSPAAWERILARAQAPHRSRLVRLLGWSAQFMGIQRVATAVAGSGLALLLAVNTELVPMTVPMDQGPSVRPPEALEVSQAGLAPSLFFAQEPARAEWVAGVVDPAQEVAEDPHAAALAAAEQSAAMEQAVVELQISMNVGARYRSDGDGGPIESGGLATMPRVVAVGEPS